MPHSWSLIPEVWLSFQVNLFLGKPRFEIVSSESNFPAGPRGLGYYARGIRKREEGVAEGPSSVYPVI